MKQASKHLLETLGRILTASVPSSLRPTVVSELQAAAVRDSAAFVADKVATSMVFERTEDLHPWIMGLVPEDGLVLEFGVHRGWSITRFANRLAAAGDHRTLHGFDSFEGLQEDWTGNVGFGRGFFDLKGRLPKVPRNVSLHRGWVQDTVAPFLDQHPDEPVAFAHLDMDTYTPTRFVLDLLRPRLRAGSVVLFDELYGYPNWRNHEYKALLETLPEDAYEFVALSVHAAGIRLLRAP